MSSPTSNSGTPKKPSSNTKSGKKPKSPGFIESSQFKPTWLETGPLSPDMLPDSALLPPADAPAAQSDDEMNVRLDTLQRLYHDQQPDESDTSDTGPRILVMSEQPAAAVDVAPQPVESRTETQDPPAPAVVSIEAPAVDTETIRSADEEIEAAIEAILEATTEPEPEPVAAATATPSTAEPVAEFAIPTIADRRPEPEASVESGPLSIAAAIPVAAAAARTTTTPPVDAGSQQTPRPRPAPAAAGHTQAGHQHRLMDGMAWKLAISGLVLLGLALLSSLINPIQRIALSTATLARPEAPSGLAAPAADARWCVAGDFLGTGAPLPMVDNGASGDLLDDDGIFSAQYSLAAGDTATWQIINCDDPSIAFPASPAWAAPKSGDQPVTFTFDSRERQARLFFPIPFVVSALDETSEFRVIGSFQDWDETDPSGVLEQIGPGLYQQVRRIARAGTHEAYIIADSREQAVDAYGRTTEPIPFSFQTSGRADYVVFLMDVGRGRASILYGMPPAVTYFAYGPGARLMSLGLALLGLLLLGWLLARLLYMRDSKRWLESGCPECRRHELMRVARQGGDRTLNMLGLPVYRYQCRDCTWEGLKLSDTGATISPNSAAASSHAAAVKRAA